jgi:hypothetical protein
MTLIGEIIYTPIITLMIIIVSAIAISIMLGKKSEVGLVDTSDNSVSLLKFESTSSYNTNIPTDTSWSNRVIYILGDKANVLNGVSIDLFDPTLVEAGTTMTIFNSPTSQWPTQMTILWFGTPSNDLSSMDTLRVTLGVGMGVTLITQQRIGPHQVVQIGGTTFNPPDLTPSLLQPKDWVVYKYWTPQANMCSAINSQTTQNAAIIDTNESSPCYNVTANSSIGLGGVISGTNCQSIICQCLPNPQNIWPPPYSPWCNV